MYNTSCYIIFYDPMIWQSARDMCEAAGFHLATIDDQGENPVQYLKIQELQIISPSKTVASDNLDSDDDDCVITAVQPVRR